MTESNNGISLLPADLRQWIETQLGTSIAAIERVSGGASRLGFRLRTADGGSAFVRMDGGAGPLSGTDFTIAREAKVLSRLAGTGVAIPRIFGFNEAHRALLMELVGGTSDFNSVRDPQRAAAVQRELVEQLAALHKQPFNFAAGMGLAPSLTIADAVRAEIALWKDLYRRNVSTPRPILDFALDWLERRLPTWSSPAALVHGDIGPGNFMFDEQGVRALIDWELVHAGHPFEDLASIIARTLGVPFGNIGDHLATYARASGKPVGRSDLEYCVVLVLTRWCVAMTMGLEKHSVTLDVPVLEKFLQANLHALVKLIAAAEGLTEGGKWQPPKAPAAGHVPAAGPDPGPNMPAAGPAGLVAYTREVLAAQILPGLTDGYLKYRCGGLMGLLSQVEETLAYGVEKLRIEELTELGALNGVGSTEPDEARRLLATRIAGADDKLRRSILQWLLRDSQRRHWLMRGALGEMFDRHLVLE